MFSSRQFSFFLPRVDRWQIKWNDLPKELSDVQKVRELLKDYLGIKTLPTIIPYRLVRFFFHPNRRYTDQIENVLKSLDENISIQALLQKIKDEIKTEPVAHGDLQAIINVVLSKTDQKTADREQRTENR